MIRVHTLCACALLAAGWLPADTASAADAAPDFQRDIRPILSNLCYQCHGFDEAAREGELRLDQRAAATELQDGQAAIVPGKPDESELIRRILSNDPDVQMPPPASNKVITDAQRDLLRRWIAAGAEYRDHWAFQPLQQPAPPVVPSHDAAPRNEIDAFVLANLQRRKLSPSPAADRYTLIRRLYQDLLGLTPPPDDVDAFLADVAPDAYERLVDRVLASPHYGERWGRHWLDQARYADSHGYTIDGARVMWPYRDWVVQALNADLPFDEFTVQQLAGDLLPQPDKTQLIATAFHRNTMINQEGGVKPDQYRHEALIDRVNTTGAVWLGLTIGCAQCHSHKFDPVSLDDYYRLYAFFNLCEDTNNVGPTVPVIETEVFGLSPEQQTALKELETLRKQAAKYEGLIKQAAAREKEAPKFEWRAVEFPERKTSSGVSFQQQGDGSLLVDSAVGPNDAYELTLAVTEPQVTAVRLRALTDESLPKQGPGRAGNGNFVLTDAALRQGDKEVRFKRAWADHEQAGYPIVHAIDDQSKTGWAINVSEAQRKDKPDLRMNAPHEAVFILAEPVAPVGGKLTLVLKHDLNEQYLIGRLHVDVSASPPPPSTDVPTRELDTLKPRIAALEASLPGRAQTVSQMIMRDQPKPPETFRLLRGDFLNPDKDAGPLSPGVPGSVAGGVDMDFRNRLDLARWLVSPQNPLTARVTVNRVWLRFFGAGLVETENDFGYQGTPPSHPELLDWLASELIRREWSLKALHRVIVTSATYRQSSAYREDLAEVDPANRWLGRQSRVRVEAEIVRDMVLAASGSLAPQLGGPSVHPPQPEGVYSFTQTPKAWPENKDAGRYRRTMYTEFFRSAPYPLFSTFDAPDFSTVCTRRVRSNTPLQALALANDKVFFELSQHLATRVLTELPPTASPSERLTFLFRLVLTRPPGSAERERLLAYWQQTTKGFSQDEARAKSVAPSEIPAGVTLAEAAAWTSLARVVFNTDEFVNRE
ncbi:MAG TPA: PSD1 and planctomycete cytochrome C domain-containing protein [Planctomycetaceae bacterium]|nr:PSD1 and planctomycete cytochrome C domain-containing protein [Planctomycetaceae bacterium]